MAAILTKISRVYLSAPVNYNLIKFSNFISGINVKIVGDLINQSWLSSHNRNESNPDEKVIIGKINRGDTDAFQYLYKEYYPALCIYAKNFTKTRESAEEVVQDVFTNLWEQHECFKINISLRSYLYISVKNACLNYLKHLQVVNKFGEYYTQILKEAQELNIISQESGDSLLIARELAEKLNREIELLPERCREILLMSRIDNMKHQEIADKLGITINTVHRQISIALEKLRQALKNT